MHVDMQVETVARAIVDGFKDVHAPTQNAMFDEKNQDNDERASVAKWLNPFFEMPIESFIFDGSNPSTVALIYASPEGVRWLLPRYMHDYLVRYSASKYSIYPIFGQLDPPPSDQMKTKEVMRLLNPHQVASILSFVDFIQAASRDSFDFDYDRIKDMWSTSAGSREIGKQTPAR